MGGRGLGARPPTPIEMPPMIKMLQKVLFFPFQFLLASLQ